MRLLLLLPIALLTACGAAPAETSTAAGAASVNATATATTTGTSTSTSTATLTFNDFSSDPSYQPYVNQLQAGFTSILHSQAAAGQAHSGVTIQLLAQFVHTAAKQDQTFYAFRQELGIQLMEGASPGANYSMSDQGYDAVVRTYISTLP